MAFVITDGLIYIRWSRENAPRSVGPKSLAIIMRLRSKFTHLLLTYIYVRSWIFINLLEHPYSKPLAWSFIIENN